MLRSPQHVASHIHLKYSRSFSSVRSPPSVLARQRDQSKLNAFETTAAVSHSRWMCVAGPSRIPIIRNRGQAAMFHSTPRQQSPQFLAALLAGVLKTSASIEYARMAARIALTFVPIVMIKNHMTRKYLKHVISDKPELIGRKAELQKRLRGRIVFYRVLIAIPFLILGLSVLASMERTPLTGRWRVILLSPEEEDSISKQLRGAGWYNAVLEILSQNGPPNIIPPTDWRYQWVQDTLRHLEGVIPILATYGKDKKGKPTDIGLIDAKRAWLGRGPDDAPLPPPTRYPLRPRPSPKEYLRWFCEQSRQRGAPHLIPGPPYNLILVDNPDCDNAFSFGFGPDGGGGIVVYSGFLDRVLASNPGQTKDCESAVLNEQPSPPPAPRSFFSTFFGSLLSLSQPTPPARQNCMPTPDQTSQLAILLAHELSHLILSHHLETLSSVSVVIPGTLSMVADLFRAVLFPVTMLFGPFVNDAVADLGKVGSGEFGKLSEYCTSMMQEFEADAVSARILAHAGFDARETIRFWESRKQAEVSECSPQRAEENIVQSHSLVRRIMGAAHPVHEARVIRLKMELHRWETERMKVLRKMEKMAAGERRWH